MRHKRDLARHGAHVGKARVESKAGHEKADAVGTEDAQQVRPGGCKHRFPQRPALRVPGHSKPGRDHDSGFDAARTELTDQSRHCRWRRTNDGKLGDRGQACHGRVDLDAAEVRMFRIDQHDCAGEFSIDEIAQHGCADAARLVRRADQCDRLRPEKVLEISDAHW